MLFCIGQGCSTTRVPTDASITIEDRSTPTDSPGDVESEKKPNFDGSTDGTSSRSAGPGSTAILALLDKAQVEIDSGREESAVATLERALRMDSKNALLWHRLALIRQHQHQWRQSLSLARKSNSLAAGNRDLHIANWEIIARASEHLGDNEGVERAGEMIEKLTNQ